MTQLFAPKRTRNPDPLFVASTPSPKYLLQATSPWNISSLQANMPKILLVVTSASKMGEKPTGAWDIYLLGCTQSIYDTYSCQ